MTDLVRRLAIVHGRVQGVGFRWAAREAARAAGVSGSATNLPDGTVRVDLEGDREAVEQVLDALRSGPPLAHVERVEVEEAAPAGDHSGFDVG